MSKSSLEPHVIIGGYLTEPLFYRPMRARLLERRAARVSIVPLHWPDWLAMSFAGFGPAMLRGARAIREARRVSPTPLVVIGHSAGGIVARLAMSPELLDGRQIGIADSVGCLVTLGTPHRLYPTISRWRHPGIDATEFLERVVPGARFAPTTGYLTVGSTFVLPDRRARTNPPKQLINRVMRAFVRETPGVRGDGIVDNAVARLLRPPAWPRGSLLSSPASRRGRQFRSGRCHGVVSTRGRSVIADRAEAPRRGVRTTAFHGHRP
ncbi:MAG: esterase/lipase family protein [Chloroflexota bacterium]